MSKKPKRGRNLPSPTMPPLKRWPMTKAQRGAVEFLYSQIAVLQGRVNELWEEAKQSLGLPKETGASIDLKDGMWIERLPGAPVG